MTSAASSWDSGRYIDAHCHIDLYPDYLDVMREARRDSVGVITVTNTPSVFEPMVKLATGFPNVVVALGLHPELAVQRGQEIALLPTLLSKTRFLGEIGLDGAADAGRAVGAQERALGSIIEYAAKDGPKIMSVHTRRAVRRTMAVMAPASGSVILHWFTGTVREAQDAVENGYWFSVNLAMLRSERGRTLVSSIPMHRVLTETDGPFCSIGNRACRPSDIPLVVDGLASLWKVDHEAARRLVMENLHTCLLPVERSGPECP